MGLKAVILADNIIFVTHHHRQNPGAPRQRPISLPARLKPCFG
jgi:hypothetical protein